MTSYEIEERQPYFFKSRKAKENPLERNHFLRDVAPTYFEPAEIRTVGGPATRTRYLVDGGVFANDPALCAYAEAIRLGESPDNVLIVSLGTGVATKPIDYDKARNWGKGSWVKPVISVMMDGVADSVDYQLRQIVPQTEAQYYRFNAPLREASADLDVASRANVNALKRETRRILDDRETGARFEELCEKLAE